MNSLDISTVEIQNCKTEDFSAVAQLLRQLYPDKSFDLELLRQAYDRSLASGDQAFLCAICGRQIVGFGSVYIKNNLLWCEKPIGYVNDMVVEESYRGQGIGTRILDHLTSWARERGCHRIELNSSLDRKASHIFYEHRGFKRGAYFYSKSV